MNRSTLFRNASVKSKLMLISFLSAGAALLFAIILLTLRQWVELRAEMIADMVIHADIISKNSALALKSGNHGSAKHAIDTLAFQDEIEFAVIYDKTGRTFASFVRPGVSLPPFYNKPAREKHFLNAVHFDLFHPIVSGQTQIGTLYIRASLASVYTRILRNMADFLLAVLAGLGVAWILVVRLHPIITEPISGLIGLMNQVSSEKNYKLRAIPGGNEEIGLLADEFNEMLAQIQMRDDALERHRTDLEQEVAKRTARLTEAQRIARLGDWEWDIVNNAVSWSDEVYHIFGLTRQQFDATYEGFLRTVHPEDQQALSEQVQQAIERGHPFTTEYRCLLPQGCVRHMRLQAEVTCVDNGKAANMVGTVQDITEEKLAKEQIRKQQELTTLIIETIPMRVFWKDHSLRYLGCNTSFARDAGEDFPDQLIGKDDFQLAWREQAEIYRADDRRVMESDIPKLSYDEPQTTPTGDRIWLRTSKVPLHNEEEEVIGVLGTYEDITEWKLAEEEIRKLNEELEFKVLERTKQLLDAQEELVRKEKLAMLGQVAGSVGHELRNPLGVMSNAVYFLQTVLFDADETTKEYLDIIKSEITTSERIVSDLLDSVRTKTPRPEMVGVAQLIGQTLGKCAIPPSVHVNLDIPTTLPPLWVDQMQIHQVFRNLISNGVEAMPEGGTLDISVAENETAKNVTVRVRDTGIGMTPEHLEKLFQPLFTTKARGIGLGLVVVKNLSEANGGAIAVDSEAGKGTAFTLLLPTQPRA